MSNNERTKDVRTLHPHSAFFFAIGWTDRLRGLPYREGMPPPYDFGRLYASEALAIGLTIKPWRVAPGRKSRVQPPLEMFLAVRAARLAGHEIIPEKRT